MPRAPRGAPLHVEPARFCLVTSAHVSNNPRLVKEADALVDAGHSVRVVAVDVDRESRRRDELLMARRKWRLDTVVARRSAGGRGTVLWARDAVVQRLSRRVVDAGRGGEWLRARALSRHHGALARAALRAPAHVFVAHNLEALPPAERAARRCGAKLVFDIEDLHSGDVPSPAQHADLVRLLEHAERAYLPRCDALTASSDGIADEVVARYGVGRPAVVLNAFPIADRAAPTSAPSARSGGAPSLYWYSQTVGPGRGLEEALEGLARSGVEASIHLRGAVSASYRSHLEALADARGIRGRLHFAPTAPADEMVALAAEHDIGLALEQPETRNRQICVTNKILAYFAAGIAIVATDTEGQRAILSAAPEAGVLYFPGDVDAFAARLRELLSTPGRLARAKRAAARAAAERYSWERERERLLAVYAGLGIAPTARRLSPRREPTGAELR